MSDYNDSTVNLERIQSIIKELEEMRGALKILRQFDENQLNSLGRLLKTLAIEDSAHTKLVYRGVE